MCGKAGLRIAGFYLQSLAASDIALSKDEKNLGVVLIDMGAGSTTVTIFEQGTLAGIKSFPIGGDYITSDIAYALRTSTGGGKASAKQVRVWHDRTSISF